MFYKKKHRRQGTFAFEKISKQPLVGINNFLVVVAKW